ncbi:hypothetical protein EYC80_003108 [Monilinia laxa]|uniref:Uncharacterized protein n=1 Tax=Monilinia laxa TaxID=61186 RepID=A0A5N6KCT8_MONLA|nr:hypothetical protein EYC80_003108 [Monilinia laxa]
MSECFPYILLFPRRLDALTISIAAQNSGAKGALEPFSDVSSNKNEDPMHREKKKKKKKQMHMTFNPPPPPQTNSPSNSSTRIFKLR